MDLIEELCKIPGIGPVKAKELIDSGVKKSADLKLKKYSASLSHQTLLNIRHPTKRISWDTANSLINCLPKYLIPVGSFRRQVAFVNDVDLLTEEPLELVLRDITDISTKNEKARGANSINCSSLFILGSYAEGTQKMSAILEFRGQNIHVDVFKTTKIEMPYALMHFTGSAVFNIRVRAQAKRLGFKLNQHGLYDEAGKLVPPRATTEKEIFQKIRVTYKEPFARNET